MLMSRRTGASFWTRARRNVEGLPDCSEGISEAAYANFLFCSHCVVCLSLPGAESLIYKIMVSRNARNRTVNGYTGSVWNVAAEIAILHSTLPIQCYLLAYTLIAGVKEPL